MQTMIVCENGDTVSLGSDGIDELGIDHLGIPDSEEQIKEPFIKAPTDELMSEIFNMYNDNF